MMDKTEVGEPGGDSMYSDQFELLDAKGNIVSRKNILHHFKMVIGDRCDEEEYVIRSVISGHNVKVSKDTPQARWHEFDNEFRMALDEKEEKDYKYIQENTGE